MKEVTRRRTGSNCSTRVREPPRPPKFLRMSSAFLLACLLGLLATTSAQLSLSTTSLPLTISLPPLNASSPAFDLQINPATTITSLFLTLSICSLGSNTSIIPAILVSTDLPDYDLGDDSASARDSGGVGKANRKARGRGVWALAWDKGFANWTYVDDEGLSGPVGLRIGFVEGEEISEGNVVLQLGAALDGPQQSVVESSLYLGDTTSTQALLFSPILLAAPQSQPTYPNYTLPPTQFPISPLPEFSLPSLDLVVIPTTSSPTSQGLDYSHCSVRNSNTSTGALGAQNIVVNATTEWSAVGNEEGYRTYWVIGGLLPGSNYTAWFLDGQGTLSQPIWFTTKQSSFPCQLVLPTQLCPSIAYAAPFTANSTTIFSAPAPLAFLPDSITPLLTSSLEAFSTSLSSKACGRDFYSHVSSCLDCHSSYRDWLCRTLIPRCTDSTSLSSATTESDDDIIPPRTIDRQASSSAAGGGAAYDYTELLPCLGVCNRVDRTCPAFMQFGCPYRSINANETYGFFGQDDARGDGAQGPNGREQGVIGSDKWGNRWCNGPD